MFIDEPFNSKPWSMAYQPREAGIAGETTTIAGTRYWVLKDTSITATAHHDAVFGRLNQKGIIGPYNRNEGFAVQFNKTSGVHSKLTPAWKHLIQLADHLLVFGPPLNGCRLYH